MLPWQHISCEQGNVSFCSKLKHVSLSQSVFHQRKGKEPKRRSSYAAAGETTLLHEAQLQSTNDSGQLRDAEAHKISCLDLERRQLKPERDTAVCQWVCPEDPDRRPDEQLYINKHDWRIWREEQEQDTDAH